MTAPATPLQLAAMRAIRAHEQEFARGIMPDQLQNAVGCQPDQMLNTLEGKHWVERDEDGWWLTDEGIDTLENAGNAPPPRSGVYQWQSASGMRRLTPLQVTVLLGIDEHWREHRRGPTKYELTRRVQRPGTKHAARALCRRGLVEQLRKSLGARTILHLALTEAGQQEADRIRGMEAAE